MKTQRLAKIKKTYSLDELKNAAKQALSKRDFGRLLFGYHPSVVTLERAYQELSKNEIATEHWFGWYRPRKTYKKRTSDPFVKGSLPIGSGTLRKKILKDKLLLYKCALCNLEPFWNGKTLTLQLDHIDGDKTNNLLSNLRFLCPNCHQQTDTWGPGNHLRKLPSMKELRELFKSGKKYKQIAEMYQVDPSTVAHAFKRGKERE